MKPHEVDEALRSAKFTHLPEAALDLYLDHRLDEIGRALADAHLNLCLICEKRLDLMKEEQAALEDNEVTDANRAFIRSVLDRTNPELQLTERSEPTTRPMERLAGWLDEVIAEWIAYFSLEERRAYVGSEEAFRFETEGLASWGIWGADAGLVAHFLSPDLSFEGATLRFRLGPFSQDITLKREGDAKVSATVTIPSDPRARMHDVSVEIVSMDPKPKGERT